MKLFFSICLVFLAACTVTPRNVKDTLPSFDGGALNSGFLGFTPNGDGILTTNAVKRYSALVIDYGSRFKPRLQPADGLTAQPDGTWTIDLQHLVYFETMNRWRKEGR